jgi:hypothetical protein
MVLERLETIIELLNTAGFKVVKVTTASAIAQPSAPVPPNTVVVQAAAPAPAAPIQRPCTVCGQEAAFSEDLPNGQKKFYCRPHGQQRSAEKAEEAQTTALFGNTGTMYARPKAPGPPPQKTIFQAPPAPPPPAQPATDLLKGQFANGGEPSPPPHNPVLDDD